MKGIIPIAIILITSVILLGVVTTSYSSIPIIKPFQTWWFPATPDFVINETSHFDDGIASNSNGNWEMETYTDNLNITNNTLQLSNLYSDRFTYTDADADTWKWTPYDVETTGTVDHDINATSEGKMYVNVTSPNNEDYTFIRGSLLTGDYDVQTNFSDFNLANGFDCYWGLWLDTDDEPLSATDTHVEMMRTVENPGLDSFYTSSAGFGTYVWEQNATSDLYGKFRITRGIVGDDVTFTWYFWNNTLNSWATATQYVFDKTVDTWTDDDMYVFLMDYGAGNGLDMSVNYDEFNITSGTTVGGAYKTTDGQWASDTQTIPANKYLKNLTLNISNLNHPDWFLDYIIIVNATNDIKYFNDTNQDIDGLITYFNITEVGGTYDWHNINSTEDWYLSLSMDSDGLGSPILWDVTGYWDDLGDSIPPVITLQIPVNTTYCNGGNFEFNITTDSGGGVGEWCGHSRNGGANSTMTNSTGNWHGTGLSLAPGSYNSKFCCNDTSGNMNCTDVNYTTLSTPAITIHLPENITYGTNNLWFNVSADYEPISWCGYSLDGLTNATLKNATGNWNDFASVGTYGSHNVTAVCNRTCTARASWDDDGNYSSSLRVFTVFTTINLNGTGKMGIREYYSQGTTMPTQWWLYSLTGNNTIYDISQRPDYNMTLNTSTDTATAQQALTLGTGLNRVAQRFISPYTFNLSAVSIPYGSYLDMPYYEDKVNTTMYLYADATNGVPSNVPLAIARLNYTQYGKNGNGYYAPQLTFIFNSSYRLTGGTKYWFVVNISTWSGGTTSQCYSVGRSAVDIYSSGWLAISTNGGTTWTHYNTSLVGIFDTNFWLWTEEGTLSSGITNKTGAYWTNKTGIRVAGDSVFVLNRGDRFNINNTLTSSGADYSGIVAGSSTGGYGAGGTLLVNATLEEPVIINGTSARANWAISNYGGNVYANGLKVYGSYYAGSLRAYTNYGIFKVTNSFIENTYNANTGYPLNIAVISNRRTYFNNVTFYKNSANAYYNLVLPAGVGAGTVFVNCNFTTLTYYAPAIYNPPYYYTHPTFIDNTYKTGSNNVVTINSSNIQNIYGGSAFFLGHSVNPKVVDSSGNSIEGAVVTVKSQFDDSKDAPQYYFGYNAMIPTSIYPNLLYSQLFDTPQTYYTNADGYALDEFNDSALYMKKEIRYDTDEHIAVYFTGNNTTLRPNNYAWKNDETDFGYIITVTHPTLGSYMEIVNATTTFNSTITLGGSEDFDGAFLLLPFLLALILGYLFINLKDLIKYMDILFIGLALMFVMIGITMLASYGGDATLTAMLEDYKQVSIWALYSFIAGIFIYGLFVAFKMWEKPKGFKDG